MKDLIFPVKKVPLGDLGLNVGVVPGIDHGIVVNDNKLVSFCSEDYNLIPNESIVEGFKEFLTNQGFDYDFYYRSYGNVRFKMEFYLKGGQFNLGTKEKPDMVSPSLYVWNSYNRSLKFQFGVQAMRLVCTNGLTAMANLKHLVMTHTSGSIEAIPKSLSLIEDFETHFDEVLETYEDLRHIPVRDIESRIRDVVEETSFPVYLADLAFQRAQREIIESQLKPTDWLVYNSLNYTLNHHADHLLGRKADDLDRRVLTYLWGN